MKEGIIFFLIIVSVFGLIIFGSWFIETVVPNYLPKKTPNQMIVNGNYCEGYYYYMETSSTKRNSTNSLVVKCNDGVTYHNVTNLKIIK